MMPPLLALRRYAGHYATLIFAVFFHAFAFIALRCFDILRYCHYLHTADAFADARR